MPTLQACCKRPATVKGKSDLPVRWLVLAALCIGMLANYYTYDVPGATLNMMEAYYNEANSTSTDSDGGDESSTSFPVRFNLLYSLYSWPNVILPFFGGFLGDRFGSRLLGVGCMLLLLVGQAVVSLGATLPNEGTAFAVMWTGRVIFGFGGETMSVVQSALVAEWFSGKELAFALGLNVAIARVGSVINDVVSGAVATAFPYYYAHFLATIVCALGVVAMVTAYNLDVSAEAELRKLHRLPVVHPVGLLRRLFCWGRPGSAATKTVDLDDVPLMEGGGDDEALLPPPPPKEEIHLNALFSFPLIFWMLTLSCVLIYIDVLVFNNNCANFVAQKFLATKPLWQLSADEKAPLFLQANNVMLTTCTLGEGGGRGESPALRLYVLTHRPPPPSSP